MFTQQIQKEWPKGEKDLWSRKFVRFQYGDHRTHHLSTVAPFNDVLFNTLFPSYSWLFWNNAAKIFDFELKLNFCCIFIKNVWVFMDFAIIFISRNKKQKIQQKFSIFHSNENDWIQMTLDTATTRGPIGYCHCSSCHMFLSIETGRIKIETKKNRTRIAGTATKEEKYWNQREKRWGRLRGNHKSIQDHCSQNVVQLSDNKWQWIASDV